MPRTYVKTYTERVTVAIPGAIRDEIVPKLVEVGLSAALRDATLRVIGHEDLVEDDERNEEGHRRRYKAGSTRWVRLPIAMTTEQRAVLLKAAKSRKISMTHLMIESLLFELGLPSSENRERQRPGPPLGKRRSRPPPKPRAKKKKPKG